MRGVPGSGKTRWSKGWVRKKPKERIRICWDDLRDMFGPYWIPEREKLVRLAGRKILEAAIELKYDIVLDNTNIPGIPKSCLNIPDYETEEKLMDTDLDTCIKRDKKRKRIIGEDVIKRMWKRLKSL